MARATKKQNITSSISNMSNLTALIEYQEESIRVTPDRKTSVFDFIRVVGGQKNPRTTFDRLCKTHPEVVLFCDNWKFHGARQRDTPVANKEGILQILGLLPGAVGRKYRAEAAKLVLAFYEAPEELAVAAFDRITDRKTIQKTKARIEGIAVRKLETNAFADTGLVTEPWQYGALTNATYRGLLGGTADELRREKGLQPKDSLRDSLDEVSLAAIALSELVAAKKATAAKTFGELKKLTQIQAEKVREAIA
jgi:hypothetical protein